MKQVEFNIASFTAFKDSYKKEVIQNNIGKTEYEIDVILEEMYIAYINKELNVNVSTLKDATYKRKSAYLKEYYIVNKEKITNSVKKFRGENPDYFKKYYVANKEKIATYRKEYYIANKEKVAERNAANKEKLAAYHKEYRAANKEKIAAQKKEYYAANRDKLIVYKKDYYVANKNKINSRRRGLHVKRMEENNNE